MFYTTTNLTRLDLSPGLPWEFVTPSVTLTPHVRQNKSARQEWYKNPSTEHNFYTAVEPANPNARPSKTNPPRLLHGLVADYDVPMLDETLARGISKLPVKPTWTERSVGGNVRLVFVFEVPVLVDSFEFSLFVHKAAKKFFGLEYLPGLDVGALEAPERLFCNGCDWKATGHGNVPQTVTQAFVVACARDYHFKQPAEGPEIPLDVIEAELKKRYPSFNWPDSFALDSQGPSFWIPESTSEKSAILKKNGFYSFSGHAERPFYPWSELLGAEFVKKYEIDRIGTATANCYFDGRQYWRKLPDGNFYFETPADFRAHLVTDIRLAAKPDSSGTAQVDRALSHIRNQARISGAAPMLYHPGGVNEVGSLRVLNLAGDILVRPSEEATTFGDAGRFPFISKLLDTIFDPAEQKWAFLAWLRHFYKGALVGLPQAGQNIFLAGGPGIGKTLLNREVVGRLMGGYADARDFMMGEDNFGADLFGSPVWSLDDETMIDTEANRSRFGSHLKKMTANHNFRYHKKFEHPMTIPWMGRIIITLNLDYTATRILPTLDESSADKLSFFRCVSAPTITFPDRYAIQSTLAAEIPFFGRWLSDWEPPAELVGQSRFGTKPHHEPSMIEKAHQGSKAAPFAELLIDSLGRYFHDNPTAEHWRGTVNALHRLLFSDPLNESILRALRLESVNRHLETIHKEGVLECSAETGSRRTRVWTFKRFELDSRHTTFSVPQGDPDNL
jgi:hypothetical protein